jgi:hypothetical protein
MPEYGGSPDVNVGENQEMEAVVWLANVANGEEHRLNVHNQYCEVSPGIRSNDISNAWSATLRAMDGGAG